MDTYRPRSIFCTGRASLIRTAGRPACTQAPVMSPAVAAMADDRRSSRIGRTLVKKLSKYPSSY